MANKILFCQSEGWSVKCVYKWNNKNHEIWCGHNSDAVYVKKKCHSEAKLR